MHFKPKGGTSNNCEASPSPQPDKTLSINGIEIEKVSETKFLGVILDDKLSWTAHINGLVKKLKCANMVK